MPQQGGARMTEPEYWDSLALPFTTTVLGIERRASGGMTRMQPTRRLPGLEWVRAYAVIQRGVQNTEGEEEAESILPLGPTTSLRG